MAAAEALKASQKTMDDSTTALRAACIAVAAAREERDKAAAALKPQETSPPSPSASATLGQAVAKLQDIMSQALDDILPKDWEGQYKEYCKGPPEANGLHASTREWIAGTLTRNLGAYAQASERSPVPPSPRETPTIDLVMDGDGAEEPAQKRPRQEHEDYANSFIADTLSQPSRSSGTVENDKDL